MTSDADMASLRHEELVALVQQLRQQVAKRDQEIEYLKRQLAETRAPSARREPVPACAVLEEPDPGSQEDLMAQLENIYPEGR
jgi:hypothetical protein